VALVADGDISGYGIIRQCREGWKIGPLFAADEKEAELVFSALVHKAKADLVFLDPPEPNTTAVSLATRHGLEPSFETARMYKGPAPDLPLNRTFGITTFELG
jgi:16S rRNA G966 N2-methylase RsmD